MPYVVYISSMAREKKKDSKPAVVSFRTAAEVRERIDKEAKRRKLTRAEFVETVFLPAFEIASPAPAK